MHRQEGLNLFLGLFLLGQNVDYFLLFDLEPLFRDISASLAVDLKVLSLVVLKLLTSIVPLQLMDMFFENMLYFEYITHHFQVEAVIYMAVIILRFVVFSE